MITWGRSSTGFPLVLLGLAILAHGVLIPWLGFYWDDWPWISFYRARGVNGLLPIDTDFRPLAGVVLVIGSWLGSENPLGWQVYHLLLRVGAGWAMWWGVGQVWPEDRNTLRWVAALLVVMPGFGHQFVAVNASRHTFPLILLFLSWGMTTNALIHPTRRGWWTVSALVFSLLTMLTTEYYYGLEIARGALIALLVGGQVGNLRAYSFAWVKSWLPYLVLLAGVFTWRYQVSQEINYQVSLVGQMTANPLETVWGLVREALVDAFALAQFVFVEWLTFPLGMFGPRKMLLFAVLLVTTGLFAGFVFPTVTRSHRWNVQAIFLGVAMLMIGGLPFWATGLDVTTTFPNNRLLLPLMPGFALIFVSLVSLLPPRAAQLGLILAVSLSVGAGFRLASTYQQDWEKAQGFLDQLAWRVPALEPGTALFAEEFPLLYSTDNSLMYPIHMRYAPDFKLGEMPYAMFYLSQRLGGKIEALEPGAVVTVAGNGQYFEGTVDQAIVLMYAPPGCLRVLHSEYDLREPELTDAMRDAVPFSRVDLITDRSENLIPLPTTAFAPTSETSWCYYFQKADLARQQGDWAEVVALGDEAFAGDDSPNKATERLPFIEGYAREGRWETSIRLSQDTYRINKLSRRTLCDTWNRILLDEVPPMEFQPAIQAFLEQIDCAITTDE